MSESPPTPQSTPGGCPECGAEVRAEPSTWVEDAPCPQCGHPLWFLRKSVDGIIVLTFLPGLMAGSEGLQRVDEVLSALGGSSRAVLDLSRLRFVSSMFLGMLVVLHKRVASANGELKLCGIQPGAAVVFGITKLDKVFDIHDGQQSALASY